LKRKFRSFEEARKFVRTLKFNNREEWDNYCKSGKKPQDIPYHPERTYKKEWKGTGDWLDTGRVANRDIEFLPFNEAKKIIQSMRIKNQNQWRKYRISTRPSNIPSNPNTVYSKEWKSWGDWFGTGYISHSKRKSKPFFEAREFVRSLSLKSQSDWLSYCKSGKKPKDIPYAPGRTYKKEWDGVGDWLGTGFIAAKNRNYRSFDECKKFVHTLNLKNNNEWRIFHKSNKKPKDIPSDPVEVYKKEWTSWGDFLGTGRIALAQIQYRSFSDAKKFIRSLGFRNKEEWINYVKSGKKPKDIPSAPWVVYSKKNVLRRMKR